MNNAAIYSFQRSSYVSFDVEQRKRSAESSEQWNNMIAMRKSESQTREKLQATYPAVDSHIFPGGAVGSEERVQEMEPLPPGFPHRVPGGPLSLSPPDLVQLPRVGGPQALQLPLHHLLCKFHGRRGKSDDVEVMYVANC